MWPRAITQMKTVFQKGSRRTRRLTPNERGLASAELMVVLPIFVLLISGILYFAGLAYYHLALLTTANDCAVMIAHASNQYGQAAELVQGAYGIEAHIDGHGEAGTAAAACSAATSWELVGVLRYTIHEPLQPYKSTWP